MTPEERKELERLAAGLPFPLEVHKDGGAYSIEPNVLWIGGCDPEEAASLRAVVAAATAVPALLSDLAQAEARADAAEAALARVGAIAAAWSTDRTDVALAGIGNILLRALAATTEDRSTDTSASTKGNGNG